MVETAELAQEKPAAVQTAELENSVSNALDKFTNFDLMGVPVGAAAMGGAAAILIDRFAIAKLDPTNKWGSWANLAAALVIKKWGGKYVGNKTADVTALILAYEAIADWVTMGINKVLPPAGVTMQSSTKTSSAVRQATAVASNYYAQAFGG